MVRLQMAFYLSRQYTVSFSKSHNVQFKMFSYSKKIGLRNRFNKLKMDLKCFESNKNLKLTVDERKISDVKKDVKRNANKIQRRLLWLKYFGESFSGHCACCEQKNIDVFNFQCGHILAWSKGGQTVIDNLAPICSMCNSSMKDIHFDEYKKNITGTTVNHFYMNFCKNLYHKNKLH